MWATIYGLGFRLEIDVLGATRRNDACEAGDAPTLFLTAWSGTASVGAGAEPTFENVPICARAERLT